MYQLFISYPCDCGIGIGSEECPKGFVETEEEAKKWCDDFNKIYHKDCNCDHAIYRKVEPTIKINITNS